MEAVLLGFINPSESKKEWPCRELGESNAVRIRRPHLHRGTAAAAAQKLAEGGTPDGIPCTYQVRLTAAGVDSNETRLQWCKQQRNKNMPPVWLLGNLGILLLGILTGAPGRVHLAVLCNWQQGSVLSGLGMHVSPVDEFCSAAGNIFDWLEPCAKPAEACQAGLCIGVL